MIMPTGFRSAFAGKSAWQENDPVGFFSLKLDCYVKKIVISLVSQRNTQGRTEQDERTIPRTVWLGRS